MLKNVELAGKAGQKISLSIDIEKILKLDIMTLELIF